MDNRIKAGLIGTVKFTVKQEHSISFAGAPPVLSTPSLIWFLEQAAIEALQPTLAAGEISLGIFVEVQHLAPTPVGSEVSCTAKVLQVDGQRISFQVEASDTSEAIARGFHRRQVVPVEAFTKRVKRKTDTP